MQDLAHVALIGRHNPIVKEGTPFSPLGSGVCIDPSGLVVTAYHVVQQFFRDFTPYELPGDGLQGSAAYGLEPHEHLYVAMTLEFSEATGIGTLSVFRATNMEAYPDLDLAILRLSGGNKCRPLPHLDLPSVPAQHEQMVTIAGFTPSDKAETDTMGLRLGWQVGKRHRMVVQAGEDALFLDSAAPKGFSGGPVYNATTRELYGITLETWPQQLANETLGIGAEVTKAVPASIIEAAKAAFGSRP
jgi:hypothetical protein